MFFEELLDGIVGAVKRIKGGYNSNGLRHSIEHLELIFPNIISMPINEQANYADFITVNNVNEDWLVDNMKKVKLKNENMKYITATTVGNLAYISIKCNDKEAVKVANDTIEKIKKHFKNELSN